LIPKTKILNIVGFLIKPFFGMTTVAFNTDRLLTLNKYNLGSIDGQGKNLFMLTCLFLAGILELGEIVFFI
jgi:hypothetical protein